MAHWKPGGVAGVCAAAMIVLFASSAATQESPATLRVLNWPDYFEPDVIAAFELAHNASVVETYYESGETRTRLLFESDGQDYDVVITDGTALEVYLAQGWLAEIGESRVPNLRHIDPYWRTVRDYAVDHAVPFTWGTLGIAYRADIVPEPLTRWRQLLDPPAAMIDRIVMIYDPREIVGAALLALGFSLNSTDERELAAAEDLLLRQRPFVRDYAYVSVSEESALVSGDVWASMVYNGDALILQGHHPDIAFVVPEEGTMLWIDYYTVLESSPNKDLAMAFIDFMNQPEIAARQAQFTHFATPNAAAEALLPADFLADPSIYPSPEVLARSEMVAPLPPQAQRRYTTIVANVSR